VSVHFDALVFNDEKSALKKLLRRKRSCILYTWTTSNAMWRLLFDQIVKMDREDIHLQAEGLAVQND
jgi:hypothetical protein